MKFGEIEVGQVFFENQTGEYYVKKSEKSAWVYVIGDDHVFFDGDGQPMQCEFPPNHEVEEI